jgi:Antirepressor AbbA
MRLGRRVRMENEIDKLTSDDQKILLEVLFNQHYEIEIISSELNDIESGEKSVDKDTYRQLVSLYDRFRQK